MADVHMLTTTDNPFNPFTHWDEWFAFDVSKGYNTSGILARIVISNDDLPEELESAAIEDAIDEIVRINALGLYRKVSEDSTDLIRDIPAHANLVQEGSEDDSESFSDDSTDEEVDSGTSPTE